MITKISDWIKSFGQSKNTGTIYEQIVGIQILIASGLDKRENIPEEYNSEFLTIKEYENVEGIINTSLDDNIGGTSDIGILKNGNWEYCSIKKMKSNHLSTCIHNPTSKGDYGINKDDYNINETISLAQAWYIDNNKGENPNPSWKRPGGNYFDEVSGPFLSNIANDASKNWNQSPQPQNIEKLRKYIDIDEKGNTITESIIFADKEGIQKIYKWGKMKINIEEYLYVKSDSSYLYHCSDINNHENTWILKTQVKFNNGLIELPSRKASVNEWDKPIESLKIGNPFTSWNVTANLSKIFEMIEVY